MRAVEPLLTMPTLVDCSIVRGPTQEPLFSTAHRAVLMQEAMDAFKESVQDEWEDSLNKAWCLR